MAMKLELAAALIELGRLDVHTLPDLAVEWLIDGIESESLILLAGETSYATAYADSNDLRDQFRAVLGELGIATPTLAQAAVLLRDQIARDIVSGSLLPAEGARKLVDLQQETEEEFPGGPFVGSGFGIATIYGLYYSYDEAYDESGHQAIDAEVIEACQQLVAS